MDVDANHTYDPGSLNRVELPQDLLNEAKNLQNLLTVEAPKLKEITDHFISELAKGTCLMPARPASIFLTRSLGLSVGGGSIVSSHI